MRNLILIKRFDIIFFETPPKTTKYSKLLLLLFLLLDLLKSTINISVIEEDLILETVHKMEK